MAGLEALKRIRANLARNVGRDRLRESLRPVFDAMLKEGKRQFRRRLASRSVSDFPNTIASKRLLNSYEDNLPSVLRYRPDGITFSFAFRSNPATTKYGDPSQYVEAIDSAEKRQGGPTTARVRQWLYDRGILKMGQRRIKLRDGREVSDKRFVFLVKRGIFRKTRQRAYTSLRIAQMFEDLVDIENPNGFFRTNVKRKLTNIVLGT